MPNKELPIIPSLNKLDTVQGQMNAPVTGVSQPSANTPLEQQVKTQSVKVESVDKDQLEFYEFNEDEILRDISIVARPLFTNDSYRIVPVDKHYAFRWVEYKYGEGSFYNKAIALGFENAKPEDLKKHQATVKDGKIYLGDVILMKIPRDIYAAQIKHNLYKSNQMVSHDGAMKAARAKADNILLPTGGRPNINQHKAEFFTNVSEKDVQGVL